MTSVRNSQSTDARSRVTAPALHAQRSWWRPWKTPTSPRFPISLRAFRTDPEGTLSDLAEELADMDTPVKVGIGPYYPHLIFQPQHVRHVLHPKGNAGNYGRDGAIWKPLRRLNGNGIAGTDGPDWSRARRLANPVFTAKAINQRAGTMVDAINEAVDELPTDRPVDVLEAMTHVVQRALVRVVFGDRIGIGPADRLGTVIRAAFRALGPRIALPFVPNGVPMPGDRAFRRARTEADKIMLPLVREAGHGGEDEKDQDVIAQLARVHRAEGDYDENALRDDVIALFTGGTETTALAATWLWVMLTRHPQVEAKVREEIAREVGAGPVRGEHLERLEYTKMVIQEVLRLYPGGLAAPRVALGDDVIDGVPIKRGNNVVISAFLSHRNPRYWPNPRTFDPERFTKEASEGRPTLAYHPFGSGGHACLGQYLSMAELKAIVAAMMTRFQGQVRNAEEIGLGLHVTTMPRQRVLMDLRLNRS